MAHEKIYIRELSAGQMEDIENIIGAYPWGGDVKKSTMLITIATVVTGEPRETFRAMPLKALGELIVFDNEDPDPNPEGADAPSG